MVGAPFLPLKGIVSAGTCSLPSPTGLPQGILPWCPTGCCHGILCLFTHQMFSTCCMPGAGDSGTSGSR